MRISHIVFLATSPLSLFACTTIQSQDLDTSGMHAIMEVSADGTGQTRVTADIYSGNSITDLVALSGGDQLTATSSGQSVVMHTVMFLGGTSYEADFSGLDTGGTMYKVALSRTRFASAPSSTCTLPDKFTIMAPTSSQSFSRALDDIVLTYTPAGTQDTMTWAAGGDCVRGMVDGTVSNDSGTFTIAKGSLVPINPPPQNPTTCQAHVTLTRSRPGQLDPHYGYGGTITAKQVRTVTFNSTP
jgi:hypothetical protein